MFQLKLLSITHPPDWVTCVRDYHHRKPTYKTPQAEKNARLYYVQRALESYDRVPEDEVDFFGRPIGVPVKLEGCPYSLGVFSLFQLYLDAFLRDGAEDETSDTISRKLREIIKDEGADEKLLDDIPDNVVDKLTGIFFYEDQSLRMVQLSSLLTPDMNLIEVLFILKDLCAQEDITVTNPFTREPIQWDSVGLRESYELAKMTVDLRKPDLFRINQSGSGLTRFRDVKRALRLVIKGVESGFGENALPKQAVIVMALMEKYRESLNVGDDDELYDPPRNGSIFSRIIREIALTGIQHPYVTLGVFVSLIGGSMSYILENSQPVYPVAVPFSGLALPTSRVVSPGFYQPPSDHQVNLAPYFEN